MSKWCGNAKSRCCNRWLLALFAACAVCFLAVCAAGYYCSFYSNASAKMLQLVTDNIRGGLDLPDSFKLITMEQPDSAFGVYAFEPDELDYISETLIDALCDMQDVNMDDPSAVTEMMAYKPVLQKACAVLMDVKDRGAFSGWLVRTVYSCATAGGMRLTFTRWTFLDKDGRKITGKLELPGDVLFPVEDQL